MQFVIGISGRESREILHCRFVVLQRHLGQPAAVKAFQVARVTPQGFSEQIHGPCVLAVARADSGQIAHGFLRRSLLHEFLEPLLAALALPALDRRHSPAKPRQHLEKKVGRRAERAQETR